MGSFYVNPGSVGCCFFCNNEVHRNERIIDFCDDMRGGVSLLSAADTYVGLCVCMVSFEE